MNDIVIKKALQQITDESNMKVLRYIADILVNNWNSSSAIGQSEWETVKNTITKEERRKAINLFLEELERLAN